MTSEERGDICVVYWRKYYEQTKGRAGSLRFMFPRIIWCGRFKLLFSLWHMYYYYTRPKCIWNVWKLVWNPGEIIQSEVFIWIWRKIGSDCIAKQIVWYLLFGTGVEFIYISECFNDFCFIMVFAHFLQFFLFYNFIFFYRFY